MKTPKIDESKLAETMEVIDRAAVLFEETDYENDEMIREELVALDRRLKELTGKDDISVENFHAYWCYADLEDVARGALMPKVVKKGLSDGELIEIIMKIPEGYGPAETDYWLEVLGQETGLDNIADYIFWPNEVGLDMNASREEIADKIMRTAKEKERYREL